MVSNIQHKHKQLERSTDGVTVQSQKCYIFNIFNAYYLRSPKTAQMRSKRKKLFAKLSAGIAISLTLEKQKDCGTRVVANTNQRLYLSHGPWHLRQPCPDLRKECQQLVQKNFSGIMALLPCEKRPFISPRRNEEKAFLSPFFFMEIWKASARRVWHSTQDKNTMNERKPLPSIYKA